MSLKKSPNWGIEKRTSDPRLAPPLSGLTLWYSNPIAANGLKCAFINRTWVLSISRRVGVVSFMPAAARACLIEPRRFLRSSEAMSIASCLPSLVMSVKIPAVAIVDG